MAKYYAVKSGRKEGIFLTWAECEAQVKGFSGGKYKSFKTMEEAESYLKGEDSNITSPYSQNNNKVDETPKKAKGVPEFDLKPNEAVAYVDGSYSSEKETPSFGVVFITSDGISEFKGTVEDKSIYSMRNVAGEISGSEKAMKIAVERNIKKLTIYHDYKGIALWCSREWKANKQGTINYVNKYDIYSNFIDISFVKVPAHTGDYYNEIADTLAKEALL